MSDFCPTFHGYIDTLQDALIVVSNVLYGVLPLVHRRPHDYEKLTILGSGTVFVFNKNKVRIKRWTDSWQWSPSRQIDDFFVRRFLLSLVHFHTDIVPCRCTANASRTPCGT